MRTLLFSAMMLAALGMTSCNGSAEKTEGDGEEKTEAVAGFDGMVAYDLTEHGMPLTIMVPDTSKAMPMIEFNNYGKLEVRVGKTFQLQIGEEPDMELRKMDLSEDLVFTPTYLVEEADGMIYRSEVKDPGAGVQPRHHFYAVVTVDGMQYDVEDIDDGDPHTEGAVEKMYKSAKAMKASKPAS